MTDDAWMDGLGIRHLDRCNATSACGAATRCRARAGQLESAEHGANCIPPPRPQALGNTGAVPGPHLKSQIFTRHPWSTSKLGDLRSRCTMGGEWECSASTCGAAEGQRRM